jgi:hypothetical protein
MTKEKSAQTPTKDDEKRVKNEEDRELSEELEMSFPASDPPSSIQPGSGITGSEPSSPGEADVKRKTTRPS